MKLADLSAYGMGANHVLASLRGHASPHGAVWTSSTRGRRGGVRSRYDSVPACVSECVGGLVVVVGACCAALRSCVRLKPRTVGSVIRSITVAPPYALVLAHVGQIVNSSAGPFVISTPQVCWRCAVRGCESLALAVSCVRCAVARAADVRGMVRRPRAHEVHRLAMRIYGPSLCDQ